MQNNEFAVEVTTSLTIQEVQEALFDDIDDNVPRHDGHRCRQSR